MITFFFSWFLQQLPEEGNDTDQSDPEKLKVIIRHENIIITIKISRFWKTSSKGSVTGAMKFFAIIIYD